MQKATETGTETGTPSQGMQPLTPGMRWMLRVASGLVFLVGIQLFIFATWTEEFFAWTIKPPLTAAFLGGCYWSSCVLELTAARQRTWARARIAVPAVLLFTILTLLVTMWHIDLLHLDPAAHAPHTLAATIVWLVVYALVPPALLVLLVLQLRAPGAEPPRANPLAAWLRVLLVLQAVPLLLVGGAFLLAPDVAGPFWPWTLPPLGARGVGTWLLSFGVVGAHMAWENDLGRIVPALLSLIVFVLLQVVALVRFPAAMQWGSPTGWAYLILLGTLCVTGLAGLWQARQRGLALIEPE